MARKQFLFFFFPVVRKMHMIFVGKKIVNKTQMFQKFQDQKSSKKTSVKFNKFS